MPNPSTYTDVTGFPHTQAITPAEFNPTLQVWFRFVVTVPCVIGVRPATEGIAIRARVYKGDVDNSQLAIDANLTTAAPFWFYCDEVGTYWMRLYRLSGTISASFTVEIDRKSPLLTEIPEGSLIVNDDSAEDGYLTFPSLPAVVMEHDGTILGYRAGIVHGETGAAMEDGTTLMSKIGTNTAHLYDPNGNQITELTYTSASPFLISQAGDFFYLYEDVGFKVYKISKVGVSVHIATLNDTLSQMTVSLDGTIMYYATLNGGAIFKWDLVNDVSLGTHYSIPGFNSAIHDTGLTPNGHPVEGLTLDDGSIVFQWSTTNTNPREWYIIHVSSGGSLINQFAIDTLYQLNHFALAFESNPYIIWLWLLDQENDIATYGRYSLDSGAFLDSFTSYMFAAGIQLDGDSDGPMFGPSSSCWFWIRPEPDVDGPTGCPEDDFPIGSGGGTSCSGSLPIE